jgi:predicted phosphoribosyltransferase
MRRALFQVQRFRDRVDAGRKLAEQLSHYANRRDVLVLGLPRGGVPVAYQVAQALNAPLDALLVRKLGVPGQEELAMGAVAMGGVRVLNEEVVGLLGIPDEEIDAIAADECRVLERRNALYRQGRPPPDVRGHTVILVDDGLATGATMRAALSALRPQGPARIVVAVPTAGVETCEQLRPEVNELVCVMMPDPFFAIGLWYEDFWPISDEEVCALLEEGARQSGQRLVPASPDGKIPVSDDISHSGRLNR